MEVPDESQGGDMAPVEHNDQAAMITVRDIKAILYLGIRGRVDLPAEKPEAVRAPVTENYPHKVDISA